MSYNRLTSIVITLKQISKYDQNKYDLNINKLNQNNV